MVGFFFTLNSAYKQRRYLSGEVPFVLSIGEVDWQSHNSDLVIFLVRKKNLSHAVT